MVQTYGSRDIMNISERMLFQSSSMREFYRKRIMLLNAIDHPLDLVFLEDMFLATKPYWMLDIRRSRLFPNRWVLVDYKFINVYNNGEYTFYKRDQQFIRNQSSLIINSINDIPTDITSIEISKSLKEIVFYKSSSIKLFRHEMMDCVGLASYKQFMKEDLKKLKNIVTKDVK